MPGCLPCRDDCASRILRGTGGLGEVVAGRAPAAAECSPRDAFADGALSAAMLFRGDTASGTRPRSAVTAAPPGLISCTTLHDMTGSAARAPRNPARSIDGVAVRI